MKKVRSWFLTTVAFWCLSAIFFTIGYIFSAVQSSGLCNKISSSEVKGSRLEHRVSRFSSELVVIIFTAPKNLKRREVIRRTWLQTGKNSNILYFFVIGVGTVDTATKSALLEENDAKKDLLLLSAVSDAYSKLSPKLLETFKWVDQHINFTFLLKVDDDSFVRLDSLYNQVVNKPRKLFYWGFFDGRGHVKTKGKWMEEDWNLCDTYLPYAKGGGYVVTSDLVRYLAQNAGMFSMFRNEDVSLGTWLAPLNIERTHDPNFDTEFQSRGCFNSYLVTHKQTDSMIETKYRNLLMKGSMCTVEQRTKLSYIYNWKALPSRCCIRNDSSIP